MKRYFNQLLLTVLLSVFCLPIFSQTTLFDYGSTWSYYDNQNEPAVQGALDWNDIAYDASLWSTGNTHLGYGDGDEVTVINSNTLVAYVRHSFNVADPSAYDSLNLNLTFDDGAVVYLNGVEVWRINMPGGTISYGTFSSSVGTENGTGSNNIANSLITGTNVLAVEIHQASSSSSDISFDFKLSANIAGQVNITRGPYLQKGSPSSMVIRWRTLTATESVVDYGTSLGNLNQNDSDLTLKTEHEVEITGLSANTVYYYEISNASTVLVPEANDVFFKTHPITGSTQPFTFWALGDAGTANNNQRAVRDAYYNYIGTNVTDGILFLGDNAYNDGTDNEYQLAVFENMYEDKLKNSVAWSCLGNHDGHSADSNTQTGPYYDIFTFPTAGESGGMASGTEAYYSFDYGNVHFIVLDSYETDRSVGSAMYNWAQSDIQNTTQEWIIAFWHHPPYTKGSHDSDTEGQLIDMRQNFLPMLESNGVDLVLSGHSHSYERSYLLNGHYGTSGTFNSGTHTVGATGNGDGKIDGNGVYSKETSEADAGKGAVYITAGSSGKVTGTLTNHNAMAVSLYELGSCIVEVDGSTLNVKFIRETGEIDDYFTIEKGCSTVGQSCDDGDDCTTNDVYDANCGCAGTFEDTDGDGVCDTDDQCPGFDDTIDTNSNGIPDGCENVCSPFVTNFIDNPLTHSGAGSNSTVLLFPTDSQDVLFTISGINQKLNGKPSNKYIEHVEVSYLNEFNVSQSYGVFSGANVSSVKIDIQGKVNSVTVALSDEFDGSTGSNMNISFSQVDYCINSTPCTPDSDGDGVCDAEDQCPGQDDALIGTACDDGNSCTIGETYDNTCNCSGGVYTDNDGDGFCIGDDPDDNDGCNPDPNSGACSPCSDIINDGFESGFGNWNDGGKNCTRSTSNPNTGSYSIQLRDNAGASSSMFTNNLDLSAYTEVTIDFSYYTSSMENGEDFFLETSTNGGSSYNIYKTWVSGTDFNNNVRQNESLLITGLSLTSTTRFRFRCDASNKGDQVYIDDVVLIDCNTGQAMRNALTSQKDENIGKSIKIFPNPASHTLFVRYNKEANITLYNINGQKVRNIDMNGQNNQTQEVDLNGLADGLYLLRMIDLKGDVLETKRIVIKSN